MWLGLTFSYGEIYDCVALAEQPFPTISDEEQAASQLVVRQTQSICSHTQTIRIEAHTKKSSQTWD